MNNNLTSAEGLVLRRLYLSKFQKGIFKNSVGTTDDFITDLADLKISYFYMRKILKDFQVKGILILSHKKGEVGYYYVNENTAWTYLMQDSVFKMDEEIMSKKYVQI